MARPAACAGADLLPLLAATTARSWGVGFVSPASNWGGGGGAGGDLGETIVLDVKVTFTDDREHITDGREHDEKPG